MRNYATAKFFLIDAACIEESGEDFALALRSFQMMFSARIIVILSGCEDMSGCIQQLLSIGVVNLITAETLEDAADELRDAAKVLVVGTSLQVYPAAGLVSYAPAEAEKVHADLHTAHCPFGFRALPGSVEATLPALVREWLA